MEDKDLSKTATALLAFAGGAALGAGLALLFAPQSGRSTRRKIGILADDAEESAKELVHEAAQSLKEAREKGGEWLGQVKDYASAKKAELSAAVDGIRA